MPPTWSAGEQQQMHLHLDVQVDDLAAAPGFALGAGATPAASSRRTTSG